MDVVRASRLRRDLVADVALVDPWGSEGCEFGGNPWVVRKAASRIGPMAFRREARADYLWSARPRDGF